MRRAASKLKKLKPLSVFLKERQRTPYEVEIYLSVVATYKKLAEHGKEQTTYTTKSRQE